MTNMDSELSGKALPGKRPWVQPTTRKKKCARKFPKLPNGDFYKTSAVHVNQNPPTLHNVYDRSRELTGM